MPESLSAKCACGAVTANLTGPFRDAMGCHCETCRRQSGHYVAATQIDADGLQLLTSDRLKWWEASETAKRGFCSECGSLMFWREDGSDRMSVFMGCIDQPTGIKLTTHIFLEEKGDYYDV